MKKFIPVFVVTLAIVLFFNGKKYDELVNSRLSSSIAICLEGQSCGQATAMNVAAVGGARSAESIYTTGCAACHDAGVWGSFFGVFFICGGDHSRENGKGGRESRSSHQFRP